MKIALLSKQNASGGGASRLAETLAVALRLAGHQVTMFTVRAHAPVAHLVPVYPKPLRRLLAFASAGSEIVLGHVGLPWDWLFLRGKLRGFDLVHIHDHWTAFNPWTLRWLSQKYPTFWTLHDCSSFTGGCLYMYDCERHRTGCGRCPRKAEETTPLRRADFTRFSLGVKRRAYAGCTFHLAAPSRWIAAKALESGVFEGSVEIVPNARDMEIFTPARRADARSKLHLEPGDAAVLLSATSLADPRKGARLGVEAINHAVARGLRVRILLMGHGAKMLQPLLRCASVDLGYIDSEEGAADAYAAADAFIFPTRADNYPLSIQESMGCGTPVVAFAVGGVPEMIIPGQTGFLATDGDPIGMADHLFNLLKDEELKQKMRTVCRAYATTHWSISPFVEANLTYYRKIISHRA